MNPPKQAKALRVLCATDLLPKSEAAIERAGMLAGELNADVSLLHVVVPSNSEHSLEQNLRSAIAQIRSRSRPPLWKPRDAPNVIVKTGLAAARIVDTVDESGADLLILGPHRRRTIHDTWSGTVAEKVLASRTSPALIVQQTPHDAYRHVLVALDATPASGHALRVAEDWVMSEERRPQVVHAYEPHNQGMLSMSYVGAREELMEAYSRNWARETEGLLRKFLKRHSHHRYRIVLEQARPAAGILSATQRLRPDLLVMGTRGHGRLRQALLGSVAKEVLCSATCDLLIVPEGSSRDLVLERSQMMKRPGRGADSPWRNSRPSNPELRRSKC